jgi:hypothetical protein
MIHPVAAEIIEMIEEFETGTQDPDELARSMRAVAEKITANPDVEAQLAPGLAAQLKKAANELDTATKNVKEAARQLEFSRQNKEMLQAKFDRLADEALDIQNDDRKKGN